MGRVVHYFIFVRDPDVRAVCAAEWIWKLPHDQFEHTQSIEILLAQHIKLPSCDRKFHAKPSEKLDKLNVDLRACNYLGVW